jgi:predicted nuclease of predicted toxin-antitoxin system
VEEAADKSRVPALKLLLDQGLARSTAVRLRSIGMDVVHVAEIGMERASDGEILVRGREEGRVIVTRDADFHAAMSRSRTSMPSVVRGRI